MNELDDSKSPLTEEKVKGLFSAFNCTLDSDIETFIQDKAINYHNRRWSSVYLIFDTDKLSKGQLVLEAYFTLSHKAIFLGEDVSNTLRKKIFGGIKYKDPLAHFVLIGHLGKNIGSTYVSDICAEEILASAFDIISKSKQLITFNSVLVECKKSKKLIDIYSKSGFSVLQEDKYVQLIRKM
jgi:hypothetical protein